MKQCFERDRESRGCDYWEIELAGKSITTCTGSLGKSGGLRRDTAETTKYKTAASANGALAKLVANKRRQGFRERVALAKAPSKLPDASNPELEAAIRAAPDDESNYLVYADWLTSQGDPRGELITVQHALETAKGPRATKLKRRAKALLKRHESHWFKQFPVSADDYPNPAVAQVVEWRRGFFRTVRLANDDWDHDPGTADLVREFFALPSAKFVDDVRISVLEWEQCPEQTKTALTTLGKQVGPQIRTLVIGPDDSEGIDNDHFWIGDISFAWKLFPNLRSLTIHSSTFKLGKIALPELRELAIETCNLTRGDLRTISAARWPELEKLILWFGSEYRSDCTIRDLKSLLEGKQFPRLRHLGLMNCELTDEICEALPRAPILRQLRTLDLSMGCMGEAGVKALVKHADAFAHLERLVVDDNFLGSADIAALKVLGPKLSAKLQKDVDDSTNEAIRYVSVGE